ncbi:MAG: HAMP domain-containing histidine kinase, partial [Blautia sp.]|nr:HAMP domain-containing histidine kinase [Blautia sp.]
MEQKDMPKELEHLKRFLILRLMKVMIFVLISEGIINLLFGQFALPLINEYFGTELNWGKQAFDMNLLTLLRLALYTILTGLCQGLPFGASNAISVFLNKYLLSDMPYFSSLSGGHRTILMMLLFVIICTYVLPYVIGVLYYSGVVVKKLEEVRDYDKRQRDEFTKRRNLLLSDITHDLKTPITTMAGYAQALNDGMVKDPDKQKQYLASIHRKSLEMSELITMLFNYVKMDSEGFSLKLEKVNMTNLVLQIVAGAYTDIENAGMDLDMDIPEETIFANLDRAQFSRSITNLVTNAVRHNDAGTMIMVSITRELSASTIRVMDSGNPIDESLMDTIFDPFVMGDESRNRRGGSGLGLSVTKKVIDMHGGKLYIEQP